MRNTIVKNLLSMNTCTLDVLIADHSESLINIGSPRSLIKQIFVSSRLIDVLLDILAFSKHMHHTYERDHVEKTSITVI